MPAVCALFHLPIILVDDASILLLTDCSDYRLRLDKMIKRISEVTT